MSINLLSRQEFDSEEEPVKKTIREEWVDSLKKRRMVDDDGNLTTEIYNKSSPIVPVEELERQGRVKYEKGFLEAVGDSSNRTIRSVASGVLKTFGGKDAAERIERGLEYRRDLDPVKWKESRLGWLGDSIGSGVTESGAMIGATAVAAYAGAPAAVGAAVGFGATYIRMYGENKQKLSEKNKVGLSEGDVTGTAVMLTLFQAGVETGFGVESRLGTALGKKMTGAAITGKVLASKEGKSIARRLASEFYKPTKISTGAIFGGVKQYGEEVTQELGAIEAEFLVSGKRPTQAEIIDRVFVQPLRAIPAGALMGGFGAMGQAEQSAKIDSSLIKTTEDDISSIHGTPETDDMGNIVLPETLQEENRLVAAIGRDISRSKNISEKTAVATAELVRDIAYAMTRVARRVDPSAMPAQFIERLKIVAMSDTLSESEIADIEAIRGDSDKVMEYLANRHGDKGGFYSAMNSIRQVSQIISIKNLQAQLDEDMRRNGAVPLVDESAKKAFNKSISVVANKLVDSVANAKLLIKGGKRHVFPASMIHDGLITNTQAAQLYVYGAEVTIEGAKYRASITQNGEFAIVPESVYAEEQKASEARQYAKPERLVMEGTSGAKLIDETIGSDTALDMARAEYAIIANKAIGLSDFMELWRSRDTKKRTVDDAPENAGVTYQNDGGSISMTGQELYNAGRKAATSVLSGKTSSADVQDNLEIRELGEDAYLTYKLGYDLEIDASIKKAAEDAAAARAAEDARIVAESEAKAVEEAKEKMTVLERLKAIVSSYIPKKDAIEAEKADEAKAVIDEKIKAREDFEKTMSDMKALLDAYEGITTEEAAAMLEGKPIDSRVNMLFHGSDGSVAGLSLADRDTIVLFSNADAGTVVHEIVHHMSSLLGSDMKLEIQKALEYYPGVSAEIQAGTMGTATEEAFADSLLAYISNGNIPKNASDKTIKVYHDFSEAIGVFTRKQLASIGVDLSDDAKAFFDEFMDSTSGEELHAVMAEATMASIMTEPPSNSESKESSILFQRNDGDTIEEDQAKNKIIGHLHGIVPVDEFNPNSHDNLHAIALEIFPDEFGGRSADGVHLKELSYAKLKYLSDLLENKDGATETHAARKSILDWMKRMATSDHPDKYYDSRMTRFAMRIRRSVMKAIDLNRSMFTNLAFYIRELDGFKFDGAWAKTIMAPIVAARQVSVAKAVWMKERFSELKQKHGVEGESLSSRPTIIVDGRLFSESAAVQVSMAARMVKDKDGKMVQSRALRAIMLSNEITKGQVDGLVAFVNANKQLKAQANFLVEAYSLLHAEADAVFFRVNGKHLPSRENYFPMIRKDSMWAEDDAISSLLENVSPIRSLAKRAKESRFKKASQVQGSVIDIDNADNALIAYTASAANYIGKVETVKRLIDVVNSADVKNEFARVYGAERGGKMFSMLRRMLEREMFASAKTTAMDDGQRIVRDIRNKFTLVMLAGRLSTMAKQTVSYLNFMAELSGSMGPAFMMRSLANSISISRAIASNGFENARRAKSGTWKTDGYLHLLHGTKAYELMKENSPMLLNRYWNPETAAFEPHGFTGIMALGKSGITVGDISMGGITLMDMLTVGTAYQTGFEHVFDQEMRKTGDVASAKKVAAEIIDSIIADTQPPSVPHQRSTIQTENEWARGLVPFSGQTMLNWQNWTHGVMAPSLRLLSEKNLAGFFKKDGYRSSVAQRFALGYMAPAVALFALSMRRWPEDEDELAQCMIMYPLSQFPVFGSQMAYMITSGQRDSRAEATYMSVGNDIIRSMVDFTNAMAKKEGLGTTQKKDALATAGLLVSMPDAYTKFMFTLYDQANTGGMDSITYDTIMKALSIDRRD